MHSTYLVVWQMMEEFFSLIINDALQKMGQFFFFNEALHIFGGVTLTYN